MDVWALEPHARQPATANFDEQTQTPGRPIDEPPAASVHGSWRISLRRTLYTCWPRLPRWSRRLALRLALPRHSLGVCAVVQDVRGRVLVAHHTYRSSAWGLPGGFVRRREQPQRALARELSEELGVEARIGPLLYAQLDGPTGHLTLYFRVTLLETPCADGIEVDRTDFVSQVDALALLGASAVPWLASLPELRAS